MLAWRLATSNHLVIVQELALSDVVIEDNGPRTAFWRALAMLSSLTKLVFLMQDDGEQNSSLQELTSLAGLRQVLQRHGICGDNMRFEACKHCREE